MENTIEYRDGHRDGQRDGHSGREQKRDGMYGLCNEKDKGVTAAAERKGGDVFLPRKITFRGSISVPPSGIIYTLGILLVLYTPFSLFVPSIRLPPPTLFAHPPWNTLRTIMYQAQSASASRSGLQLSSFASMIDTTDDSKQCYLGYDCSPPTP